MAAENPPIVDQSQIVTELRDLRAQRASGTYYLVSDDNRQCRIGLAGGEIASVSLRGGEGMRAFEMLATMRVIRTRFAAEGLRQSAGGTTWMDTNEIYKTLLQGAVPAATVTKKAEEAANGPIVAGLSATAHQYIRQTLTNYLGPLADIVYDEHRISGLPVETMLTRLATELGDKQNAAKFLADVRQRLQELR